MQFSQDTCNGKLPILRETGLIAATEGKGPEMQHHVNLGAERPDP